MKEMCRNFTCSNDRCAQTPTILSNNNSTHSAEPFPATHGESMNGCSNCVMSRIGLAQAYTPLQPYTTPMPVEQSLICGTAFSELAMPYCSDWNLYRFRREE